MTRPLAAALAFLAAACAAPMAQGETLADRRPAATVAALLLSKAQKCWDGDYDSRVDGYTNNVAEVSGDPASGRATIRFVKYRGHAPSKSGGTTYAEIVVTPDGTGAGAGAGAGARIEVRHAHARWIRFGDEVRRWLAGDARCFVAMRPY